MINHKPADVIWSPEQRDYALEHLWTKLEDIPMNPEAERMEAQFLHFPAGTDREAIWYWFDERYTKGVASLLYGRVESKISQIGQPDIPKELCPVCRYGDCAFNYSGICYVSLVYGQISQGAKGNKCRDYIHGGST